VDLTEKCRLKESLAMFRAFREGLSAIVPTELLALFTASEVEQLFTGETDHNKTCKCSEYVGIHIEDTRGVLKIKCCYYYYYYYYYHYYYYS
jgi:hypothetical protein